MKWKKKVTITEHKPRLRCAFLLIPQCLPENASSTIEEWRWLEFAYIYQEYESAPWDCYVDVCWAN